jgi:hypothetical protein
MRALLYPHLESNVGPECSSEPLDQLCLMSSLLYLCSIKNQFTCANCFGDFSRMFAAAVLLCYNDTAASTRPGPAHKAHVVAHLELPNRVVDNRKDTFPVELKEAVV